MITVYDQMYMDTYRQCSPRTLGPNAYNNDVTRLPFTVVTMVVKRDSAYIL